MLGAAIDYVLMGFAPTLGWLFLGRSISGLTGASITVATAYIADISTDKNRAANFGMVGAAFGLGFIAGPAIGGVLGHWNPQAPFIAAACLNFLNFCLGLFVLPESLAPSKRRPVSLAQLHPLRSITQLLKPGPLVVFFWIHLLIMLAGNVHPSSWTLYTEAKFGWTPRDVGFSLGLVQALPGASDDELKTIEKHVQEMHSLAESLESEPNPLKLLSQIFQSTAFMVLEEEALKMECQCSRERVESALKLAGKEELTTILDTQGQASVRCDFCSTDYVFEAVELQRLVKSL
jgi:MFS family permease